MSFSTSTKSKSIRVAIVGSGPSAFYTAEQLQKQTNVPFEIDMFERLPTPFGLVRGGVAPDHLKIKSVTRIYDRIASQSNYRFFGNVTFGQDVFHADLVRHYHLIVYAVGAQTDRQMNIPGEDLPGSHAATEFVGWFNGHPDYKDREFDLSQERVAVIGNGNVAMDVARILARTQEGLWQTDIADYALEALRHSKVKEIFILGRRGPIQAKFTNPEIKELGELADAEIVVSLDDIELDPLSRDYLLSGQDRTAERNYQTLKQYAQGLPTKKSRAIIMRFLVSPVEVIGDSRVTGLRLVKNELCEKGNTLRPCPTDEFETLSAGLVFRSIGYHGVPLPDVPFDLDAGIIPNQSGRVSNPDGTHRQGEYVVGWIKRGPTGIIGTNKPDAQETTLRLLEDVTQGRLLEPIEPSREAIVSLLAQRGVDYVTYDNWLVLDQLEIERGKAVGRPRVKFTSVEEMLSAIRAYRQTAAIDFP